MKKTIRTDTEVTRDELRNPLTITSFDGIAGALKSNSVYDTLKAKSIDPDRFILTGRLRKERANG